MNKYTLNISPCPKPRMTQSDRWKVRPATSKYWAFKDEVAYHVTSLALSPADEIMAHFYIEMPKSWSAKKRAQYDQKPHQQKPDIDNYLKALLDAMYVDDSTVWKIESAKYWAIKPRIDIWI